MASPINLSTSPKVATVRQFLERCGLWLSRQAAFTLVTLLVFLGIAAGLWRSLPGTSDGTRGVGPGAACSHVSVDFAPAASLHSIKRLLRAEDAYIVYGPDEFGAFQLRFSDRARADGPARLRADPAIDTVQNHADCP
jgi:hypothetical protein